MSPDIEKYRKQLKQYCLSKDIEEQLIHSYWSAIERLVDRELTRLTAPSPSPPARLKIHWTR